jgi:glyoxylase I family protein
MSTNPNTHLSKPPQRLHHNARLVKDHEQTRQFYEDVVGMPLLATWAEVAQLPDFAERPISYCHAFYGLADGGALAFFGFAEPDVYEAYKAKTRSFFNHITLAVPPEHRNEIKQKLQDAGRKTIFIDHGYCQSLYVQDPDDLTLELPRIRKTSPRSMNGSPRRRTKHSRGGLAAT